MNTQAYIDVMIDREKYIMASSMEATRKVGKMLFALRLDLLGQLDKLDPTTPFLYINKRIRLDRCLKASMKTIDKLYGRINDTEIVGMALFAEEEAQFVVKALNKSIGIDLVSFNWSKTQLKTLVSDMLIVGSPSKEWWLKQSINFRYQFAAEMRMGLLQGETLTQLRNRIVHLLPKTGKAVAFRNAEALIRTSYQTVANETALTVYQANPDVIKKVQFLAWLDSRTTDICRALHKQTWPLASKKIKRPPRHWNCRSRLVPLTYSLEELSKLKKKRDAGKKRR